MACIENFRVKACSPQITLGMLPYSMSRIASEGVDNSNHNEIIFEINFA
jgi:hypothetical protein